MPGGYNVNTRQRYIQLSDITRPVGGGLQEIDLPKTGILSHIHLLIRGSIAGSLSALNALGKASVIRQVRLRVNQQYELIRFSGPGYHYLIRENMESHYIDPGGATDARAAVATGTFNIDMVIPIALNLRDPLGLLMLQNEETLCRLSIDFETDAVVATGATVTCTVTPVLELFTVPVLREDWPPFNVLHTLVEEQQAIAAAGDIAYNWPRGNIYCKTMHGLGLGVAGADLWSRDIVQINHGDVIYTYVPNFQDNLHRWRTGRARPGGAIFTDLLGSDGLGDYGLIRDAINTRLVTDIQSVITATGAGTLFTVREELVLIAPEAVGAG